MRVRDAGGDRVCQTAVSDNRALYQLHHLEFPYQKIFATPIKK
jgi:hypothetical protein